MTMSTATTTGPDSGPLIRNISDTARWVAVYRARETERPDALFRDPLARRLAGERGERIAGALPFSRNRTWALVVRTLLFDAFITEQVAHGVDLVVNLAAGLDARPYRMALPPSLRWVEVDLPEILDYKEGMLQGERPVCALERVRLDLADASARRELFQRLGRTARKALIVSEGLLIYLTPEQAAGLARDLATPPSFQNWVIDIQSPGLKRMIEKEVGSHLTEARAPFQFAPEEGPGFFVPHGWRPVDVRSVLKTAARVKRVPWFMRLIAKLPESKGRQGAHPWSAICLLERG
jgi:methyltransferase (TIGR00027 family)